MVRSRGVLFPEDAMRVASRSEAAQASRDLGGAWTHRRLGVDVLTTLATPQAVGELFFTPAADLTYQFKAWLMVRTTNVVVGPQPGITLPTGLLDGAWSGRGPTSNVASVERHEGLDDGVVAISGLPLTTKSYLATIEGLIVAGATPAGNLQITIQTALAGTEVRVVAGSALRYRTVP